MAWRILCAAVLSPAPIAGLLAVWYRWFPHENILFMGIAAAFGAGTGASLMCAYMLSRMPKEEQP